MAIRLLQASSHGYLLEARREHLAAPLAASRQEFAIGYFVGFITAVMFWALCAYLYVPDSEDFGGIGQMAFMAAVALVWIPLWTCLVGSLWRITRGRKSPAQDRFVVSPRRRDGDPVVCSALAGAVMALLPLVLLSKVVEQDTKYGTTALALTFAILPVAAFGAFAGAGVAKLRNRQ